MNIILQSDDLKPEMEPVENQQFQDRESYMLPDDDCYECEQHETSHRGEIGQDKYGMNSQMYDPYDDYYDDYFEY